MNEVPEENWASECCKATKKDELSPPWHELKHNGQSELMREGICPKCGKKAYFVRQ